MGITHEQFWLMTPRELKPYQDAYKMHREQVDQDSWTLGAYMMNAFGVVLANAFGSKGGTRAKYLEHPFSWRPPKLTDEEIKEQTMMLFKRLEGMQQAFEESHPKPAAISEAG